MSEKTNEIVTRKNVREIVREWLRIKQEVLLAIDKLNQCEQEFSRYFPHGFGLENAIRYNHGCLNKTERLLKYLESSVWGQLFASFGIWQFLSVEKSKQLYQMLERHNCDELGPLDEENVMQLLQGMLNQLTEFAEEAVVEVYNSIRPDRSKLKTNSPYVIGKSVILERWCESRNNRYMSIWGPRVAFHFRPDMQAIDRIFHLLDGNGYVSKTYSGELVEAIDKSTKEEPFGETKYFKFRVSMNGNLRLTFKRPELVQKLNEIAGRKMLAPCKNT